eukprot:Gb_35080 [translate_table: standard]
MRPKSYYGEEETVATLDDIAQEDYNKPASRSSRRDMSAVGWLLLATGSRCRNASVGGMPWFNSITRLKMSLRLATIVDGNPSRPVDGINTIGMLLTSSKADTEVGYLGILAEGKGRDPNYFCPLACLRIRQTLSHIVVLRSDVCLKSILQNIVQFICGRYSYNKPASRSSRRDMSAVGWLLLATGSRCRNASVGGMPWFNSITRLHDKWRGYSQQTLYSVWRPTKLAAVASGNLDRPIDGVNTIGMILTSAKANTADGYPGVLAKDEGRDPDYFSLSCLTTRQRFRCGGVLDDILGFTLIILSCHFIIS